MAWIEPPHHRPEHWPPTPPEGDGDDNAMPCVEFHPLRCPYCQSTHVPYYSRRGLLRYHRCRECRRTFKSLEIHG
jgi:hypothetical protein